MPDVSAPESGPSGPAPESTEARAETRKVVRSALLKRSREVLANPVSFSDDERQIFQFGSDIYSAKDPRMTIEKKASGKKGTDLLMPVPADNTTDADGKPAKWEAGKVRIASINGRDADGKILCTFNNVADDSPVLDGSGAVLALPVTNDELFDAQIASEGDLYGVATNSNPVVAAELQVLQHERGQGDLPDTQPTEAEVEELKDKYEITDDQLEEHEPMTALEKADAKIQEQITKIQEALTKNPPDPAYEGKENRVKAQQALFNLLMAEAANGNRDVLIKAEALQKLHDSGLPVGDLTEEIAGLSSKRIDASQMLGIEIENLIRDPESGITSDKVIQELLDLYDEKGILAFLQDNRVQKLTSITESIMGKDFKSENIAQLIQASQLSPDKKAALDKALKSGAKKEDILLVLLMLLGLPVVAAAGLGVAAVQGTEMLSKMR